VRIRLLAAATAVAVAIGVGKGLAGPSGLAVAAEPAVHGWPGSRTNPAGHYSWPIGEAAWMHCHADGSAPFELTLDTLDAAYGIPVDDIGPAGADLGGPYTDAPERVADVRLQAWLMDVEESRVVVIVRSVPETTSDHLAEAEAIVGSIRVEPGNSGSGHRLVFTLPAGCDNG
jgi:hypothetical protein